MTAPLPPLVLTGNCLNELKRIPDASIAAVVTDPPYGLSNTDPAHLVEALTHWANGDRNFIPTGRGFMGKSWDAFVPPPAVWDECLRILKPGGHLLAFAGSRTFDLMTLSIRFAGFDIRDSIAWLYGSGFPKSLDVGKALPEWEGWGTALKPAFEPILVARKPLIGTVAANVLEHGTGALNIDATRVGAGQDYYDKTASVVGLSSGHGYSDLGGMARTDSGHAAGRWPANVVLDESQAAELDEQAPNTGGSGKASGPTRTGGSKSSSMSGAFNGTDDEPKFYGGEKGGASRFFYVAKAPKSERPVVDGTAHPTVKPLALMRWLIRLVTPVGDCVVDPFAGSGTTLEAAYLEGMESIGVEMTTDYLPLIQARIDRVVNA